jgi:hypothetical protein
MEAAEEVEEASAGPFGILANRVISGNEHQLETVNTDSNNLISATY